MLYRSLSKNLNSFVQVPILFFRSEVFESRLLHPVQSMFSWHKSLRGRIKIEFSDSVALNLALGSDLFIL